MEVSKAQQLLQMIAPRAQAGTKATSDPAAGAGASGDSTSITANDFLSLLVAEMKNQDPTANTDPNEYINQLVQVNSLQQLIQINQDLGGSSASSDAVSPTSGARRAIPGEAARHVVSAASRLATSLAPDAQAHLAGQTGDANGGATLLPPNHI